MPDLSGFALCSRHIWSNTCHVMPSPKFTYYIINHWQIYANLNLGEGEKEYIREKWNKFSGWDGRVKLASTTTANSLSTCIVQLGLLNIHFSAWILSVFIRVDWLVIFYSSLPFFRWILVFRVELFSKLCQPLFWVLFGPCSSLFTQIEKLAKYFPLSVLVLPQIRFIRMILFCL